MATINEMAEEVYNWAHTKGWEPDMNRSFGDECALIHSEVSEMLEAYREIGMEERTVDGKPDDVPSEMADVLIRLLHYATVRKVDLEKEFRRKMDYNNRRAFRHGGKRL